jgi:hypothetical protein
MSGAAVLVWAVKDSLVGYVRAMADGRIELDGTDDRGDAFAFPATGTPGRFSGRVTFSGHHGMMRVVIAEPWIEPAADEWMLSIADPDDPDQRLPFARIARFDGVTASGTVLTADGADLFFGPYREGTQLDDPRVR